MAEPPTRRYRGPQDAIRVGLKPRPFADLFYWLVSGSWGRLVTVLVGTYVGINLMFAELYQLDGVELTGGEHDFIDTFAFSVQTLATIGYGAMAPLNLPAHLLVMVESLVGLLGFAIATGLMFSKFSRPNSRVLFSQKMIVNIHGGRPRLMFRAANARGNEVVDAVMHVSMLKTEVTPEGHTMRRLHDLRLVRSNQPLFALTWLVMHEIDEQSPLWGETAESLRADNALFVVSMTGIDGTFAQTVHARTFYLDDDIEWGKRFADVVETLPSGQLRIDYARFDETTADPHWPRQPNDQPSA